MPYVGVLAVVYPSMYICLLSHEVTVSNGDAHHKTIVTSVTVVTETLWSLTFPFAA